MPFKLEWAREGGSVGVHFMLATRLIDVVAYVAKVALTSAAVLILMHGAKYLWYNHKCQSWGFDKAIMGMGKSGWECTIRTPPHRGEGFSYGVVTQETYPVDMAEEYSVEAFDARREREP